MFFFVFILGNFGLPGTINFVGEVLIFIGAFVVNNFVIFCSLLGLFLTLVYSLFIYTRLSMGLIRVLFVRYYADLTRREFYYILPLFVLVIYFGLFPNVLFDYSFSSLFFLIFGI